LTFLLVDPFQFVENYSLDLGPKDLSGLMPENASDIAVLAILTLPDKRGEAATVNLQGPLALNNKKRVGRQLALESPQGLRFPIELSGERASQAS
jgi:flagellar assembly factor FliW